MCLLTTYRYANCRHNPKHKPGDPTTRKRCKHYHPHTDRTEKAVLKRAGLWCNGNWRTVEKSLGNCDKCQATERHSHAWQVFGPQSREPQGHEGRSFGQPAHERQSFERRPRERQAFERALEWNAFERQAHELQASLHRQAIYRSRGPQCQYPVGPPAMVYPSWLNRW